MPSKIPPGFEVADPLEDVIADLKEYATLYPERLNLDDGWLEDWVKFSQVKDEFRKATKCQHQRQNNKPLPPTPVKI